MSADGHTVVEVNERQASAAPAGLRRRLHRQDLVVAFHELATLLESGVSLADAVIGAGPRQPPSQRSLPVSGPSRKGLMHGQSFREALRAGGFALPDYVYHLVEAGELSGRLAQSLRRAVEQMRYDQRVAAEMRSALLYPSILVVSGIAAVLLVFVFVVPQFSNLLEDGNELPLVSEAVLRVGVWFNAHWWWLVGALAGAAVSGRGPRAPAGGAPAACATPWPRSPCSAGGSPRWTPRNGRR